MTHLAAVGYLETMVPMAPVRDVNIPMARAPRKPRIFGPRYKVGPRVRLAWAVAAVACMGILGVARYLEPDPRGYGTHQGLNQPPCSAILLYGLPCPTCGMTTAFSLVARARPLAALAAQPAGAVFCVAIIALVGYALYVVFSGSMVSVNWDRIGPVRFMLGVGGLILGGWGFKLAHGLLTGTLPVR